MTSSVSLSAFLNLAETHVVIDVRSPIEYKKGHIPNSVNLPLLDDEQRKIIGTLYKQEGRNAAVLKGFELVGPLFAEKAKALLTLAKGNKIGIYCWRGGLRTEIMSWIASLSGLSIFSLKGGYKSFRNEMLKLNEQPIKKGIILGGQTGSGKTLIIHELQKMGYPVIDLEAAASHRGSSFGAIGLPLQTQEMFENLIAFKRYSTLMQEDKVVWLLEDESRLIGTKCLPLAFYDRMQQLPKIELLVDKQERIDQIIKEYGKLDIVALEEATVRLRKKLGDERTKQAVAFLHEGKLNEWISILLDYYDKSYNHSADKKLKKTHKIAFSWKDYDKSFQQLIALIDQLKHEQSAKVNSI